MDGPFKVERGQRLIIISNYSEESKQTHSGRTCNKGWSYTRVIQYEFVGAANEEVRDVQSRFFYNIEEKTYSKI